MKTKDLKEKLKVEASKITLPDLSEDILVKHQTFKQAEVIKEPKKKKRVWFIPSLVSSLVMVGLVVFLIVILNRPNNLGVDNGPNNSTGENDNTPGNPIDDDRPSTGNPNLLTASKEVIGKEIMLASSIVDDNTTTIQTGLKKMGLNLANTNLDDDFDLIHEYVLTADMLINRDNVDMNVYLNEDSEYSQYKYYMYINYNGLTSKFYYNEEGMTVDAEDLDEVSINFSGIMIEGNEVYDVVGTRENELNQEYETTLTLSQNGKKILTISQEFEQDENEYTYIYYDNNQIVKEISQSVELLNPIEMEIEIVENQIQRQFTFTYLQDYILLEYEYEDEITNQEIELEVRIHEYDSYYEYEFINSNIENIIKLK